MARIVIVRNGEEVASFSLEQKVCSLGRDPASDIPLSDPSVSRSHARLTRVFQDYYLEDLESTNGTLLNDRVVTKHLLRDGDRVRIGNFHLRFVDDASTEERTQTAVSNEPAPTRIARPTEKAQISIRVKSAKTARVRFFRGPHKGQSERIERALYTIGEPGGEVAAIARRPQGFFLLHIGGDRYPKINNKEITTTRGVQLNEGDVVEVGEHLAEISFA